MKFRKFMFLLFGIAFSTYAMTGCDSYGNEAEQGTLSNADSTEKTVNMETEEVAGNIVDNEAINIADMFSDRDKEVGYDENNSVSINLQDTKVEASDSSVKISEQTVTITEEGTYILKGNLTNGQIVIDAEKTDKIQLVLEGVSIDHTSSAPIYVKQADKVFVTLANGSLNSLSTSGEFVAIDDNNIDAVIYSKEDLTINGEGSLAIATEYGNGITAKDDLVLAGGKYNIKTSGHGLEGKDSVRIANGSFTITSSKDGIHSENTDDASLGFVYIAEGDFHITAQADGIDSAAWLQIDGGNFTITTREGSSNSGTEEKGTQSETTDSVSVKGLKSDGSITVNRGTFNIDTADDSIHSNSDILISDGTFELYSGNDGIHADAHVTINGGKINIAKSYEGIEGQCVNINEGQITLVASDDGINAANSTSNENAYIKISGGSILINANGDGVDSNSDLYVTGGETFVLGPSNSGNGAIDYDGTAEISGGIFVAVGTSGMVQNFGNTSTQASMLVSTQSMQNGALILKDSTGKELLNYTPEKTYNSVVISTPDIKQGETYQVIMGADTQSVEMTELIYGTGQMGAGGRPKGGTGGKMGGERLERPNNKSMN